MERTFYEPDSIDEELAVMEERDAADESLPFVSMDTLIAELPLAPAQVLGRSASVADAVRILQHERVSAVAIVEFGRLVGIFTERDVVMRVVGPAVDLEETPISELMTRDPESLRLNDPIVYVLSRMLVGGFRHVPVVDEDNRPLHIIAMRDLMAHLLERADRRISTLPPAPFHGESKLDIGYG